MAENIFATQDVDSTTQSKSVLQNTTSDEDVRTFGDSNRKVQTDNIVRIANRNVQNYLEYKEWSDKKQEAFMNAYSNILDGIANGDIDYRTAGLEWRDRAGMLHNQNGRFDAVGEVLLFLNPIVNSEQTYTPPALEDFTSTMFNKFFIDKKYGGNKPTQQQWDAWRNLDVDDGEGHRGKVNRAHVLASMIPDYISYIRKKKFNFKNSAFGSEEEYVRKLKKAQAVLSDGTYDDNDIRLCGEIGINLGDFLSDSVEGEAKDVANAEEKSQYAKSPEGVAETWNKEFEQYMNDTYGDLASQKQKIKLESYDEQKHGSWKQVKDSNGEISNLGRYLSKRSTDGKSNAALTSEWNTYVGLLYKDVQNAQQNLGSSIIANSDGTFYIPESINLVDHTGWVYDPKSNNLEKRNISQISSLRQHLSAEYVKAHPIAGAGSVWFNKKGGVMKYADGGSTSSDSSSSDDSSSDDSSSNSPEDYTEVTITPELLAMLQQMQAAKGGTTTLQSTTLQSTTQLPTLQIIQTLQQPIGAYQWQYLQNSGSSSINLLKYLSLAQLTDPFATGGYTHNYYAEQLALKQQEKQNTQERQTVQKEDAAAVAEAAKKELERLDKLEEQRTGRTKAQREEDARCPIYKDEKGKWHTNFKTQDYERMASLVMDIGSLIAATAAPGYGTIAGAALGLASSGTNFVADITSGESTGTALKNLAFNAGADLLSLVPYVGAGAETGKLAKTAMKVLGPVFKWGKRAAYLMTGLQGFDAASRVYDKLSKGQNLTTQDWMSLYHFTKGIIGLGKAKVSQNKINKALDNASIKGSTTINPKLTTKNGNSVEMSKAQWDQFTKFKTVADQENYLKNTIKVLNLDDALATQTVNTGSWLKQHLPLIKAETKEVLDPDFYNPGSVESTVRYDLSKLGPSKYFDLSTGKYKWWTDAGLLQRLGGLSFGTPVAPVAPTETIIPEDHQLPAPSTPLALPAAVPGVQTLTLKRRGGRLLALKKNFTNRYAKGGQIFKYRQGSRTRTRSTRTPGTILGIGLVNDAPSWGDSVGKATWEKILDILGTDKDYWKIINEAQTAHAKLRDASNGKWSAAQSYVPSDNSVADYQEKYQHGKYGSWNDIAIGPNFSRYDLSLGNRYSKDRPKDWHSDNWYANITDDRRLLGRDEEYSPDVLNQKNEQLKKFGLQLFKDSDNYYKLKQLEVPKKEEPKLEPILPKPSILPITINNIQSFAIGRSKGPRFGKKLKKVLGNIDWGEIGDGIESIAGYIRTRRANRKNYRDMMAAIKPNLIDTYNLQGRVLGDLATENYYNNLAAKAEHQASKARTSDATLNALAAQEANVQADEYRTKGYLADNERIKETMAQAKAYQDDNAKRRMEVANYNAQEMNRVGLAKAELTAQNRLKELNNLNTLLGEFHNRRQQKRALQKALAQEYIAINIPKPADDLGVRTAQNDYLKAESDYKASPTKANYAKYTNAYNNYNQAYTDAYTNYQNNYYDAMANLNHVRIPRTLRKLKKAFNYQLYKSGGKISKADDLTYKYNKLITDTDKDNKKRMDKLMLDYYKEYMKQMDSIGKEIAYNLKPTKRK